MDTDSPGPNSDVTYEIISGNFEDKFIIEPQQGLIVLKVLYHRIVIEHCR